MKTIFKILGLALPFLFAISCPSFAKSGQSGGGDAYAKPAQSSGGGDAYVAEFLQLAHQLTIFSGADLPKFRRLINETRVVIIDPTILNTTERSTRFSRAIIGIIEQKACEADAVVDAIKQSELVAANPKKSQIIVSTKWGELKQEHPFVQKAAVLYIYSKMTGADDAKVGQLIANLAKSEGRCSKSSHTSRGANGAPQISAVAWYCGFTREQAMHLALYETKFSSDMQKISKIAAEIYSNMNHKCREARAAEASDESYHQPDSEAKEAK